MSIISTTVTNKPLKNLEMKGGGPLKSPLTSYKHKNKQTQCGNSLLLHCDQALYRLLHAFIASLAVQIKRNNVQKNKLNPHNFGKKKFHLSVCHRRRKRLFPSSASLKGGGKGEVSAGQGRITWVTPITCLFRKKQSEDRTSETDSSLAKYMVQTYTDSTK